MTTNVNGSSNSNASGDDRAAEQLAAACQGASAILLELRAEDALCLISQLQLALRHPNNFGRPGLVARAVADRLINSFPPHVRMILDRGFCAAEDVPGLNPRDAIVVRVALERDDRPDVQWDLLTLERRRGKVDLSHCETAVSFEVRDRRYKLHLAPIADQLLERLGEPIRIGDAQPSAGD